MQADAGHVQPTNTEQPPWSVTYGPADLRASKRGALCISESISHHATDNSVIYRSAQLAINLTLYPQTADILSPSILVDHFFGYLAGKQATPGWLNHMNTIELALTSILSVQLRTDPRNQNLRCLSFQIHNSLDTIYSPQLAHLPGVVILRIVSQTPGPMWEESLANLEEGSPADWAVLSRAVDHLSVAHKRSVSRMMLQTIWQWKEDQGPNAVPNLKAINLFCGRLMANDGHTHLALRTHCLIIMVFSLRGRVFNLDHVFVPDGKYVASLPSPSNLLT